MRTTVLYLCMLFAAVNSLAQTSGNFEFYLSRQNNGLCSSSISLYKDGWYRFEQGCEASSHVSFGKWKKQKDTFSFIPVAHKALKVVDTIIKTGTDADSIHITIRDKYGEDVTHRITMGWRSSKDAVYFIGNRFAGANAGFARRPNCKLRLVTLCRLFNQDIELDTDTAGQFLVKLKIAASWISDSKATQQEAFQLVKKNGDLESFLPFGAATPGNRDLINVYKRTEW